MSDSTVVPPKGYAELVRQQLAMVGEDPDREGLLRTPERVAKANRTEWAAIFFAAG